MPSPRAPLTFVTVVFEPEISLLRLQATSLARFLDEGCVEEIIVLDNCAGGMGRRARRAVRHAFGAVLVPRVAILRTAELGVDSGTEGWRSQQAAKLLIARRIRSSHFVILDAKNHLIRPVDARDFIDAAGRARGGTHPYSSHPLRADLERTLRYLGADADAIERTTSDFPPTATPFVINTDLARRMLDDIERTSGRPFAAEFERARLLEFFLYSGWSILQGAGMPVNGDAIHAPIIWPRLATDEGAAGVIRDARDSGASWFAVHRRVLARADPETRKRIIRFWVDTGLMDESEAVRFVRRFRLAYVPAVGRARIAQRLARTRHFRRVRPSPGASA